MSAKGGLSACKLVAVVSGCGMVFGYNLATICSNPGRIINLYLLRHSEYFILFGSLVAGSVLGMVLGAWLTVGVGRRPIINCGAILGMVAFLFSSVAPDFSILLCSQFAAGTAMGMFLLSAAIYINEILPPGRHGLTLILLPGMALAAASLSLLAEGLDIGTAATSLAMLALNAIFVVLSCLRLPESPRWLALNGHPNAALEELCRIRSDLHRAAREMAGINDCCRGELRGFALLNRELTAKVVLFWLLGLMFLVHLSGVEFVPYAFLRGEDLGGDYDGADPADGLLIHSLITTALLGTVLAGLLHDRFGTRLTVIGFALGILIALSGLFSLLIIDPDPLRSGFAKIFGIIYLFFAWGLLLILSLVVAVLLFPLRVREIGVAVIMVGNSLMILMGMEGCIELEGLVAVRWVLLMCIIAAIALLFIVRRYFPELMTASMEGVEVRLIAGRSLRELGH